MRLSSVDRLRCPECLATGVEAPYEVDPTRVGGGEDGGPAGELVEGFLVCRRCRATRPLIGGVPVLVTDLGRHLVDHGNVYRRAPIADPRVTRFVLGQAGMGGDVVPFEEVVERYGDLLPATDEMPARSLSAVDRELAPFASLSDPNGRHLDGPALEIGCGVGRGTFELARITGDATGVDRSVARVRRARNVQTAELFLLPPRPGARIETPIDLGRLHRDGVDFVVAEPYRLPFGAGTFRVVVLRPGDGEGPWRQPGVVRAEAERVLAPRGTLMIECRVASAVAFEVPGSFVEIADDDGPAVA